MSFWVKHNGATTVFRILNLSFFAAKFKNMVNPLLHHGLWYREIHVEHLLLIALCLGPHRRNIVLIWLKPNVYLTII